MRKIIVIGLVLLAAFAGWQAASPWMAMDSLRDAAREGDREALEQAIDFPALRESAKAELYERIDVEAERSGDGDIVTALGANFAKGFADGIVEAVVTPSGMSAMLVTGSLAPQTEGEQAGKEIDWRVRWIAFDTFEAVPEVSDGQSHPTLVFRRSGLGWKLAGIDIPD